MAQRYRYAAVVAALIIALCAWGAEAGTVPRTLNHQGYLTKTDGTPVSSPVSMAFALYSTTSGSTPLWQETHAGVPVTNGIYSVVLGDTTPINIPFDHGYYLGITVGTDPEMAPRQPLTSVPYAVYATKAGCNPGDMVACYTGTPGTLGTGICKAGTRTCMANGTGYGPCVGEVDPAPVTGCAFPTCTDGVKNGTETDVDCGGSTCPACAGGKACLVGTDCASGVCNGGICTAAPTCTDGVKNGTETDVDCGGGTCPACGPDKTCYTGSDCLSGNCLAALGGNLGICGF